MAKGIRAGHSTDNQDDVLTGRNHIGGSQEVLRVQSEAQPRLEVDNTDEALNVNIFDVLSLANLKSLALENKGPVARDHVCFFFFFFFLFAFALFSFIVPFRFNGAMLWRERAMALKKCPLSTSYIEPTY